LTISPKSIYPLSQFYLDKHLLYLNDQIFDLGKGSAQKNLDVPAFRQLKICFPENPHEQHRIVTLLDEAFADIATAEANAETNLQNARELFDSALNAIEGKKEQLGEYVTIKTGKLDANAAVIDGEYPFFTCSREIFAIDNFAFDCEAILLAGNNAVGDFNVKHYSGKFNAYQRTYVITIQDEEILRYRYLYFQMLKSLKKFKEQSVGSSTKFLKLGMIKELEITLPPVQEQDRQLKLLSDLLEQVEDLESIYRQKLTALDDLKKSLLHQAFSGQI
jgi:type I restriction enzyme S subunit